MPAEAILSVQGLTKRYEGLLALAGIDFDVARGEIFGVIGPNGAGKTTLFSCLVGAVAPTSGNIRFRGDRIDGLPNHAVVTRGLVRTHQIVRPFRDMTVRQNVSIGAHFGSGRRRKEDAGQRVGQILEKTGLIGKAEALAGTLTIGELKRLEIARALAT
ncbi:MAG TPA: ATP-binding cassette domain-containing protein, partial [Thermoanaerobaculia bacterium]|nr:ATP-binding cassette domain-containing protein [Thermoanaerobaculia bacterium]